MATDSLSGKQAKKVAWVLQLVEETKERIPEQETDKVSDLRTYISQRKQIDSEFEKEFDEGYAAFKIGVLFKQAREASGMTQEELAEKLHTKKSAISRIENHAEDIRVSTLERFAAVLGRRLEVSIR